MVLVICWNIMNNKKTLLKRLLILYFTCFIFFQFISFFIGATKQNLFVSIREKILLSHYLHATVSNVETFGIKRTKKWLCFLFNEDGLDLYIISKKGEILSCLKPNKKIIQHKDDFIAEKKYNPALKHHKISIYYGEKNTFTKDYMLLTPTFAPKWFLNDNYYFYIRIFGSFIFAPLILMIFMYFVSYPIKKIQESIQQFNQNLTQNNLDISKFSINEVSELHESFDWMFKRIEQSLQNKQNLMELISHEIRSPLTRQRTALQLIEQDIDKERNLTLVKKENENIKQLVNEIFSYLNLHQSQIKLKLSTFNLNHMIEDIIDDCQFEFDASNIKFTADKTHEISSDITLLSIAIQNLIKNSLKYAGIEAPIEVNLNSKDNKIIFCVTDHGPGVSPQSLEAIFKPFFRTPEHANKAKGTGLGLALTEKIIELHHGEILAYNTEPHGLSVVIFLTA